MAGFRRVFSVFPGYAKLGSIESVNVVDVAPPSTPLGAGTGTVLIVGEFEDGPLEAPSEVVGGSDLVDKFGGFGWTKGGAPFAYPVARRSGGSLEVWEGNGFVHLYGLKFSGLLVCRVDNSAGEVSFSRLAYLDGGAGPWDLEPGQKVDVSVDAGPPVTATFNAAAATITGAGGTYPTGFVGGETLEVKVDGLPSKVVFFTASDQTLNQVVARINAVLAMTIASNSGGQLRLSSYTRGYSGRIEVVSGTARTTLGLPLAPTPALWTWTFTPPAAGNYQVRVTQTINGTATNYDSGIFAAAGAETATQFRDGIYALLVASPGVTYATDGTDKITATGVDNLVFTISEVLDPGPDIAYTNTTPAVLTASVGTGNVADIDRVQRAEAIALLEPLTGVGALTSPSGELRITNTASPLVGTIQVLNTSTADLGFDIGLVASAVPAVDSPVPAGTLVRDPTTGVLWITLVEVVAALGVPSAVKVKVRPATDDDTAVPSAASGITELVDALPDAWAVTNAAQVVRLNAFQMDVRYEQAIAKTLNVSGVPFKVNAIYSARHTAVINRALAANAVTATATGHRARKAVVSPPINTTRAAMQAGPMSVAANRSERVFYLNLGAKVRLAEIATLGKKGGVGFTDDGVVRIPSDGLYASVRSILPPEENAGQQLSDTNYGPMPALGLEDLYDPESGLPGAVNLLIEDYEAFRAAGMIALRVDRTAGLVFQSDVTSVDANLNPSLVDAKRRWMGDFVIDSLMDIGVKYVKKLNTPARRQAQFTTVVNFLDLLRSRFQPDASRIVDFKVVDDTSSQLQALGFQTLSVKVKLFPSMDFIVFRTEVGTTVQVTQQ